MNPSASIQWSEWNQRQLRAALDQVYQSLARAAGDNAPAPAPAESTAVEPSAPLEFKSALNTLCGAFGLSQFERAVLLLCAGPELDSRFATMLARLNREPNRIAPTFALALALLPGAHWSALSPAAPLRRWRLLEVNSADSFVNSPLRIDERVLHFLCGVDTPDERLRGLLQPCLSRVPLAPAHARVTERIRSLWQRPPPHALVQLLGSVPNDQRAIAAAAGSSFGLRLYVLRAADVPGAAAERDAVARLWEREASLSGALLLVDTHEAEPSELARTRAFLEDVNTLTVIAGREPLNGLRSETVRVEVPLLPPPDQCALWHGALGAERAAAFNGEIEAVSQQFRLDATTIQELAATHGSAPAGSRELWQACRQRTRGPIESLAERIDARATWDDLVLPPDPARTLRELAVHVRQRYRVYEQWGFAAKQSRGLGISALFSGPSGTGKTLAAEVLAGELQLDLFRIDLSAVVNKYIGETEKNLRRVFDAAEAGGAILLFDEADALFGKRSEVRDSHDRYANIEVGYLLQRMESYRGLAILTTNMRQALDTAFLRRLRFVVPFPFPDTVHRKEIWRRAFPTTTPTENIDHAKLARLNVSGGHIRNIALNAAMLAADANEPVRMKFLQSAARSECMKMERPPSDAELGGWA